MTAMAQRVLDFTCNICSASNSAPLGALTRETATCSRCGSTVRMRAMVHAVSMHLFGRSMPIDRMPSAPGFQGIGLSDWVGYADRLAKKLSYTNTFYTRAPHLDITRPPPHMLGTLDFIISTDVFEHVTPPVSLAFTGACALLKPGGALIFSVPYVLEGETREHFPDLHDFSIIEHQGTKVLRNTTRQGAVQEFTDLCFHGGEGATLEMRLFSRSGLFAACDAAVLGAPEEMEDCLEFGIHWVVPWSRPMVIRKEKAVAGKSTADHAANVSGNLQ